MSYLFTGSDTKKMIMFLIILIILIKIIIIINEILQNQLLVATLKFL